MHIGYIIPDSTEIMWLNDWLALIAKTCRKHKSFRDNAKMLLQEQPWCAACGTERSYLEVHHIEPVWALSVEFMLEGRPTSHKHLMEIVSPCCYKAFDYSEWHAKSNLAPLCPVCHLDEQAKTDKRLKLEMAEKYRLVYSYRVFDKLYARRYTKRPIADIEAYLNEYLERQLVDLRTEVNKG